jgi:hypothetical protein
MLVVQEAEKRERPPGSEPGGLGGEVFDVVLRRPRSEVPGAPLGRRGHCHERRDGGRDVGVRPVSVGGKHECAAATAEIRGHARRTPRTRYTWAGRGKTRPTGHVGLVKHRLCHRRRLSCLLVRVPREPRACSASQGGFCHCHYRDERVACEVQSHMVESHAGERRSLPTGRARRRQPSKVQKSRGARAGLRLRLGRHAVRRRGEGEPVPRRRRSVGAGSWAVGRARA